MELNRPIMVEIFIFFVETILLRFYIFFFFFNDTATTEIYTLSLHDALPIWCRSAPTSTFSRSTGRWCSTGRWPTDRKSTRLNSSHTVISYAVFCLKKKNKDTVTVDVSAFERRDPLGPPL